jgi:hypothetical protein
VQLELFDLEQRRSWRHAVSCVVCYSKQTVITTEKKRKKVKGRSNNSEISSHLSSRSNSFPSCYLYPRRSQWRPSSCALCVRVYGLRQVSYQRCCAGGWRHLNTSIEIFIEC